MSKQPRSGFAQKSIAGVLIQVSFAGLSFLNTVLLARFLGKAAFGKYAFVLAIVSLLAVPTSLGLPTLIIRETSKAVGSKEWGRALGVLKWARSLSLRMGAVLAIIVISTVSFGITTDDQSRQLLYVGCLLIVVTPQLRIAGAAMQGLQFVVRGQLPDKVIQPALLATVIVTVNFFWPDSLSTTAAMTTVVATSVAALLLSKFMLRSVTPAEIRTSQPIFNSKTWLSSAVPLALTGGMLVINRYTDVLMIGAFKTDDEVGLYRVAAQVSSVVSFGLTAVNIAIAARIARLHQTQEHKKLQRLVVKGSRAGALFAIPATIGFILFGRPLLVLFFKEPFLEAWLPSVILIAGQLFNSLTGSVGYLLNMTGHEKEVTRGVAISACANIVLNASLIPFFGVLGAAVATAGSLVLWNILLWRRARTCLGINCAVWAR